MLVFRCECEQVLGVESEASKGGLGECPSCGRIIRVPSGLVNAAGRLKVTAPPQRASGAYRLIKDVKPDTKNGSGLSPAVQSAPPPPPLPPAPEPPKRAPEPPAIADDLEPETLAPITESKFERPVTDSAAFASLEDAALSAEAVAAQTEPAPPPPPPPPLPPAPAPEPPPSSTSGRKEGLARKGTKSARATPPQQEETASVPAGADKNFTTGVTAIRHRKPDSAISDAPQRSVTSLFMIIGVIVLIVAAVVWYSGVLSNNKPNGNNVPAPTTTPVASPTTSATPAATSTETK